MKSLISGQHCSILLPKQDFCVQFWTFAVDLCNPLDCDRNWSKLQTFQANLWESRIILRMYFDHFHSEFDVWIIQVLKCSLGFPQKQKKQTVHRRRCAVRKKKDVILRKKTEANDVEVVEREYNHVYFYLHGQQIRFESLKNARRCKLAIYIRLTFPQIQSD